MPAASHTPGWTATIWNYLFIVDNAVLLVIGFDTRKLNHEVHKVGAALFTLQKQKFVFTHTQTHIHTYNATITLKHAHSYSEIINADLHYPI